jgi:hypothetical protein
MLRKVCAILQKETANLEKDVNIFTINKFYMESNAWCYYIVPASLALFGLGMAFFVSRGLKRRTGKIEQEIERLAFCLKAQPLKITL